MVITLLTATSIWLFCLGVSVFATYRLFEYGPFNTNLIWDTVREKTDILSSVALGVVFVIVLFQITSKWYVAGTPNLRHRLYKIIRII
jgi:uncharacterized membrane protein